MHTQNIFVSILGELNGGLKVSGSDSACLTVISVVTTGKPIGNLRDIPISKNKLCIYVKSHF